MPATALQKVIVEWRARNRKQLRLATTVTVVIALLIWQTVWLRLRLPLTILLIGQLGTVVSLLIRNRRLKALLLQAPTLPGGQLAARLAQDWRHTRVSAGAEGGCQLIGFVWLGYEFFLATHSFAIAALIGFVYPVSTYLAIVRPRLKRQLKQYDLQQLEILGSLPSSYE